jgi:hypothetical protein
LDLGLTQRQDTLPPSFHYRTDVVETLGDDADIQFRKFIVMYQRIIAATWKHLCPQICEWNKLIFDMMGQTAAARSTEMGEINAWQVFRMS